MTRRLGKEYIAQDAYYDEYDIFIGVLEHEEVIRCKDCKWADWYTAGDGRTYCYCSETGNGGNEENDFCSRAERAEE